MAEKKVTPAVKKVTVAKPRAKTGSAVAGKTKAAAAVLKPAAKKVVAKKTVAKVTETTKAKPPVVTKVTTAAAKTKAPVKKTVPAKVNPVAASNKPQLSPGPEERYRMVQTAAYFIAEQHGFQGRSDAHWAAAEREIAAKLGK
jgi:hypothetical protein